VKVSVGVGTGRHADQYGGDLLRPQTCKHEALLSTHAASREHDRLAIPVGPREQVIQGARVAQVHIQEIRFLAIGVADA
jgi:hypothetical protein